MNKSGTEPSQALAVPRVNGLLAIFLQTFNFNDMILRVFRDIVHINALIIFNKVIPVLSIGKKVLCRSEVVVIESHTFNFKRLPSAITKRRLVVFNAAFNEKQFISLNHILVMRKLNKIYNPDE